MDRRLLTPVKLDGLFSRTISVFGRAIAPALIICLLVFSLPGVLLMVSIEGFYSSLGELFQASLKGASHGFPSLASIGGDALLLVLAGLLLFSATVVARLGVTTLTCAAAMGIPMTWQRALKRAMGVRFGRALGQLIVEYLALGGVIVAGYIILLLFTFFRSGLFTFLGIVGFLACLCTCLWLGIRWSQTYAVLVCEDIGPLQAFSRSTSLVGGEWWRVFGVLLLFWIVKEMVVGILTYPPVFLVLGDLFEDSADLLKAAASAKPDLSRLTEMFSSLGVGMGIGVMLTLFLSTLVVPTYGAALYVDLRARLGEFGGEASAAVGPPPVDLQEPIIFYEGSAWGDSPNPQDPGNSGAPPPADKE